jgi:hypothetical protein
MSKRSRKWRKRFACGHRGFGRYCHRCAEVDRVRRQKTAVQRKQQRLALSVTPKEPQERVMDGVNLAKLPKRVMQKAKQILGWLRQGIHPGAIGGKQFGFDRDVLRIPVGYRYRLLCRRGQDGFKPLKIMSHEAYNSVMRNTRR